MFVAQVVLLAFCGGSTIGFAWLLRRAVKRSDIRDDLQRQIYLASRSSKVTFVAGTVLGAAFMVIIGLAALGSELFAGWGLIAMAILPLLYLACYIHLARLPYTYPEDL